MKRVAYLTDPIYLKHDTGRMHPESPQRLVAIEKRIAPLKEFLTLLTPIRASKELLRTVHAEEEIARVYQASLAEEAIDTDTICSRDSYDAACTAVGAGIAALDAIKSGEAVRAFCAIRPPGHHARPSQAMGFCLFNNIAIAAKYAQKIGYEKVMIIDFDVHHGNGTQEVFYDDDTVFYFSSHQSFSYPGTGMEKERGTGRGEGYTANFLMMPDGGDEELLYIYHHELPPLIQKFEPDIILVSAGYDLHESDPLAQLNVTTEGIGEMVRTILDQRDVPSVFFLEGGYDVDALGDNVKVTIEEMLKA
jgi:acetoin utilization deacetylase AcuC-like enzyme